VWLLVKVISANLVRIYILVKVRVCVDVGIDVVLCDSCIWSRVIDMVLISSTMVMRDVGVVV